jgi:carbon-monoxide dehydrogenase medium subunit
MSETAYYTPETVEHARQHLATEEFVKVVAGGQTLMLLVRQGFVDADALVDVSDVSTLSGIDVADGTATIGATTTYRELATHDLGSQVAMLGETATVVGDRQVRAMGTVGGALGHADPAFDLLPTLCCLDAEIDLGSTDGERTVPIERYLVGHMRTECEPDELIERVRFDVDSEMGTAYEKHARVEDGWATVGTAAAVTTAAGRFEDVRVGLAAVADTAIRSPAVEDALVGEPATDDAIEAASEAVVEDIDPLDDLSGSAEYKRSLAPTLVERTLGTALDRAGGER